MWSVSSAASHVILPGVGAAKPGMQRLREAGLVDTIRALKQPVLGVCLGMQLLFEHSEEDDNALPRRSSRNGQEALPRTGVRVPHMGWNRLRAERNDALLKFARCELVGLLRPQLCRGGVRIHARQCRAWRAIFRHRAQGQLLRHAISPRTFRLLSARDCCRSFLRQ